MPTSTLKSRAPTPVPFPGLLASPRLPRLNPLASIALAGLLLTLLNCLKPLHIDDATYLKYATHIAEAPLSPYGFEFVWINELRQANDVIAPPALLYWWAIGIRLFGEQPFLWKLWLMPFNLLFAFSLYSLCQRFVGRCACSLTWLVLLSPLVLPGLNLMLDIPAMALSLGALVLYLRACDREHWRSALLSGLVLGLALETKYTGLVMLGVIALYGLLFQGKALAAVTLAAALSLFISWEMFLAVQQGESHFLHNFGGQNFNPLQKAQALFMALFTIMGCLSPALILLAALALGARQRVLIALTVATALGYGLVALWPAKGTLLFTQEGAVGQVHVWHFVYTFWGLTLWLMLAVVGWRLLRPSRSGGSDAGPGRSLELFLLLWLVAEIAGYFVLSPFPAARRVLGPCLVVALVLGRLLSHRLDDATRRSAVRGIALVSALLGLMFFAVDLKDARAAGALVHQAAHSPGARSANTIWYVADWGIAYEGPRSGMEPLVLDQSRMQAGDWLFVPDAPLCLTPIQVERMPLEPIRRLTVDDRIPLKTVVGYYGGRVPLERRFGPRAAATIYRVTEDFIPTKDAVLPR